MKTNDLFNSEAINTCRTVIFMSAHVLREKYRDCAIGAALAFQ